jgi:hypothetical protein
LAAGAKSVASSNGTPESWRFDAVGGRKGIAILFV